MASITLTKVFVNLLATGEAVSANSADERTADFAMSGEVRQYAGGRQRALSEEGEVGTYVVTLVDLPKDSLTTLRGWKGQPVLVRNHRGDAYYATFFSLKTEEVKDQLTYFNVSITFNVVTADAGV